MSITDRLGALGVVGPWAATVALIHAYAKRRAKLGTKGAIKRPKIEPSQPQAALIVLDPARTAKRHCRIVVAVSPLLLAERLFCAAALGVKMRFSWSKLRSLLHA